MPVCKHCNRLVSLMSRVYTPEAIFYECFDAQCRASRPPRTEQPDPDAEEVVCPCGTVFRTTFPLESCPPQGRCPSCGKCHSSQKHSDK
jgi:hypothetical protein